MPHRPLVLVFVLAFLATACGDDPPAAPPVAPPPPPNLAPELEPEVDVDVPAETSIRLLDAGGEPRHVLRFTIPDGTSQRVRVATRSSGEMTVDGRPVSTPSTLAGSTLTMELTAGATDERGAVALSFDIQAAEPILVDDVPSREAAQFRNILASSVGIHGDVLRGADGLCEVTSVSPPPGTMGQRPAGIEASVQQSMDVLSVPVPPDAVGVGARWEVVSPQNRAGTRVRMSRTYELLARDGEQLVLELVVRQQAAPGPFSMPGMNPAAETRLRRLDAEGTGRIEANLTRIVPDRATLTLDGKGVFVISDKTNPTVVMRRTTRLEFTIESD